VTFGQMAVAMRCRPFQCARSAFRDTQPRGTPRPHRQPSSPWARGASGRRSPANLTPTWPPPWTFRTLTRQTKAGL